MQYFFGVSIDHGLMKDCISVAMCIGVLFYITDFLIKQSTIVSVKYNTSKYTSIRLAAASLMFLRKLYY